MVRRMDMVKAAALGALAVGSWAQAAEPAYMQEQEKGRRPLMSVIDRTGSAQMLDDIGVDVSGHVQLGYTYSTSNPPGDALTGRVFDDQHDELYLHQAAIVIQRTLAPTDDTVVGYKDKFNVGFKVDFMYGQDGRLIHSNGLFDHQVDDGARNEEFDLTQAYLEFGIPVGNGLLVTAGKFVTPIGFETINPTTNPLYSHSYLFGYAIPFTHTGVNVKYNFSDSFYAMVGVNRGWEQSLEDNNADAVSFLGSVGYTYTPSSVSSQPINLILNVTSGPERADNQGSWRTVVDLIASTQISDQLTVALNADYGYEEEAEVNNEGFATGKQAQWYGVAAYAGYKISDMFTVNGRAEWFNDKDGSRGIGTNVYEATLGVAIKPFPNNALGSNLVFRPEVRYDYGQESVFDGGTDHDQLTFAADLIFAF